jgi:hypothetical protein
VNASTIKAANEALDRLVEESERRFGKADADDVAHHVQTVAKQLGIAFVIDDDGNVQWTETLK